MLQLSTHMRMMRRHTYRGDLLSCAYQLSCSHCSQSSSHGDALALSQLRRTGEQSRSQMCPHCLSSVGFNRMASNYIARTITSAALKKISLFAKAKRPYGSARPSHGSQTRASVALPIGSKNARKTATQRARAQGLGMFFVGARPARKAHLQSIASSLAVSQIGIAKSRRAAALGSASNSRCRRGHPWH
jgi:hypothetical protein